MATISQFKNNTNLCPVLAYTSIVKRILSYPKTTTSTSINTVLIDNQLIEIKSSFLTSHIRSVVAAFGKSDLGFSPSEVGTHSVRSSTAMQLFLNKVPTYQIMLLGRWSSDAFLRYIHRQVNEFSAGLSDLMIKQDFFTIPDIETVEHNDLRTQNTASFATASSNGRQILGARFPNPAVSTWL